jgi:hypothetical protein
MAEDERNALLGTQVSEPVPGEDAFNRHDQAIPVGRHGFEKGFRIGFHIAVQQEFTVVAQETDIHASGMQVDAAVKWGLMGVESHEVSPS